MPDMKDYKNGACIESWGDRFRIGVHIQIAGIPVSDEDGYLCMRHAESLKLELLTAQVKRDPEVAKQKQEVVSRLSACFPEPIHVRQVPNEYCGQWCCEHLPWLIVTTKRGAFKIGWRKRVISLDWSGSDVAATAEAWISRPSLVTCSSGNNAWSYEDAARYVAAVLKSN